MYNSWMSHMILYIKGKEHGRIIPNSIFNGLLVYGPSELNDVTRTKTYEELSDKEKLQDDCDVRAINTENLDAFDLDCDEAPLAKAVLMANLSSYDSYIISWVPISDTYQDNNAKFAALEKEIDTLEFTLSKNVKENESLTTTIDVLKNQTKEKEDKYIQDIVDLEKKKKELDNIVYKVVQSMKTMHMLTIPQVFYDNTHKQALGYQNPIYLKKAQLIKPTLYEELVVQPTLVKTEVPRELLKESFKDFNNGLHFELNEVKMVFNQMEAAVEQSLLDNKCFEIQKKELLLENDRLLELIISQDIVHTAIISLAVIVDYKSIEKSYVIQIFLWYLDSGCFKHMTRQRSYLINFVNKFMGTVKFCYDHIAKIMRYGDYQLGNVTISRVYYVEGLGHNLFFVEAISTACYTRNRSLICLRPNKTPYELIHDKIPNLTYLRIFGALCYPTNDSDDLDKMKPKDEIGIFVSYAPQIRTISSGHMPNPPSPTPYVPPKKNDWDILFQPMFDEYLNPPKSIVSPGPVAAAPRPADPTVTP
nr:integrase, catalytic region, zinc finger, CCHC-type, peptidase aspartic, catalytic [Tanacetum cinerariifolium]